jgi:hypothetical protein
MCRPESRKDNQRLGKVGFHSADSYLTDIVDSDQKSNDTKLEMRITEERQWSETRCGASAQK